MDSVNLNSVVLYSQPRISQKNSSDNNASSEIKIETPNFKQAAPYTTAVQIRTSLTTKDERKKYNELSEELDSNYRKKLNFALKSGLLLKNDSNDKSSVLDNLHKIITEERDPGLNKNIILNECLDILTNPYVITQSCEDIPREYKNQVVGIITNLSEDKNVIQETEKYLDNMYTGTCPAASIEFDLATKKPAEFFRIVEGLTSPEHSAVKTIKLDSLSTKSVEAIWLLNAFKTPHKINNFETAQILLKPDENAIIRARIQNNHRDKGERSIIDVLMQSTLMQLGSQQTYDSLTSKRAPNLWTQDDGGLIEFEKTYVESVVEDKNTTSVTYQKTDEQGRLIGYEKDFKTIKRELLDTLKLGHNVIIGYTWPDPENNGRLAGHEVTIIGYKPKSNGDGVFIVQDSDDDLAVPIEMKESYLLPKIHHAGIPDSIASRDFKYEDSWKIGINEYNQKRA